MTSEQEAQKRREEAVKLRAVQEQRSITYIDADGCEVTVTPEGHTFYNIVDWW